MQIKKIDNSCLIQGDCLEIMPSLPGKSIDFICCDLPYGCTQNKLDVIIPFEPLWKNYERLIKDDGCIALFGQGLFYVDLVNSNRKLFRYDLVWDKVLTSGFLNAKRMPLRRHEQIAIFYKKMPTYNPQFTVGEPLHSRGVSYKKRSRSTKITVNITRPMIAVQVQQTNILQAYCVFRNLILRYAYTERKNLFLVWNGS